MPLSVCYSTKNVLYPCDCIPGLPIYNFPDHSTYYALAEYIHGPRFFIGIDPYGGGYLQDNDLHKLLQLVELARKDFIAKPERWLVWTSPAGTNEKVVTREYYATKENVEMTLKGTSADQPFSRQDGLFQGSALI